MMPKKARPHESAKMARCRNVNFMFSKFVSQSHLPIYRTSDALSRANRLSTASIASAVDNEQRIKSLDEIPGPKAIPVFGTAYRLFLTSKPIGKRALELQLKNVERYGPITKNSAPGVPVMINVYHPSDAEKVFRSEPKYPKRFDSSLFRYYRESRKKEAGLFFLNGRDWYKHRSVISKRVLKPKEVAEYVPAFNEIISDLVPRLRSVRGSHGEENQNEVPNLDNELFKWSFESVGHVLFDKRFCVVGDGHNPEAQEFISAVQKFLSAAFPAMLVPVWVYKYIYETATFKEFVKNFDKMYSYAELFIGEKIRELESQGKLDSDETNNNGERVEFLKFLLSSKQLTKDDLLASVIDLLFAGVDTTSNTMQWVLYMMGKNPEKQELLYQEVSSVLVNGEHASAQSLTKMPYLKAWVRETLRLYPVFNNLSRKLSDDLVLSGYKVPAGTQVNVMFYAMSLDENIFKDATEFKPERWLRNNNGNKEEMDAFSSLPFGFGTRMCIGRRLAETELYLLLARVVQEFHIQYHNTEDVEPFMRGITMPDRPVRVKFMDRK